MPARTPPPPPPPPRKATTNTIAKSASDKAKKRALRREKALSELVETEATFSHRVGLLMTYYVKPLEDYKIVRADQHGILFRELEVIKGLSDEFLTELIKRRENWDADWTKLSDLFEVFTPFFRMYQGYVCNHDKAVALMEKLKNKKNWKEFLAKARENAENQDLSSLLILPIQRIPRYKLLLTEVLENSAESHPDYKGLSEALSKVEKVAKEINDRMKEIDRREKVRHIERKFTANVELVSPAREFLKEGKMWIVGGNKDRLYQFFLFNDKILYASSYGNKFNLHEELPINREFEAIWLDDNDKYSKYSNIVGRGFEVISTKKSFVVCCNDGKEAEAREWFNKISDAVKEQKGKPLAYRHTLSKAQPVWIPDSHYDECTMDDCDNKFSLFNRRHHCRRCGKLVCGSCGKYELRDPHGIAQRVCKQCYFKRNGNENKNENENINANMSEFWTCSDELDSEDSGDSEDSKENATKLDELEEKNGNIINGDEINGDHDRANNSTQKAMTPPARRRAGGVITIARQENSQCDNDYASISTTSPKRNNNNNNNKNNNYIRNRNRNRNEQSAPPTHAHGAKLNVIGLNNMGNTCFMNSAIQCLLHATKFSDRLVQELTTTAAQAQEKADGDGNNGNNIMKKAAAAKHFEKNNQHIHGRRLSADTENTISTRNTSDLKRAPILVSATAGGDQTNVNDSNARTPPRKFFSGDGSHNSMYDVWINLMKKAYQENLSIGCCISGSSFSPSDVHSLMAKLNPLLGDDGQHHPNEALATILRGIEESLPEHLKYLTPNTSIDTVFDENMGDSIYSDEYKCDFTKLKANGKINEESNLVTSNFDGIEIVSDTCLECGFQRRFFNQFREISINVHTSYVKCNVIYYDKLTKCYKNMNFKMGESSTVEMLKYVALCHMFDYKQGEIYQDYCMDQFELIQLNNLKLKKKRNQQFNNLASILESDDSNLVDLSEKMYGKVECILVPVKKLEFNRTSKEKANDGKYVKYIHFQISLIQCNTLSLCVLAVPSGSYNQKEFQERLVLDKIGLCDDDEISQEENVNIVSYHNGSLKKYEKDNYFDFQSDKNGIIITYLDGDEKKNDDSKYLQYIIDGIDSLWSNKNHENIFKSRNDWGLRSENLHNLESCLEEMEEKRYITGEDVMMPGFRCKCKNGTTKFVMREKQVIVGPKLLIIVLNRGAKYGENSKYNYNHTIKFDEDLALTNGDKYDLRAVCNYSDDSGYFGKFGHYTADVKQLGTNIWHHCNDSIVSQTSHSTSFYNCRNAIMMIFSKE